ncbi:UNVERIFIED_CONTAM: Ubiquitin-conjugating enzyme E2 C [Trichonephila clavipes]
MSGDKGISAFPVDENIFDWIGTINGAQGTFISLNSSVKILNSWNPCCFELISLTYEVQCTCFSITNYIIADVSVKMRQITKHVKFWCVEQ